MLRPRHFLAVLALALTLNFSPVANAASSPALPQAEKAPPAAPAPAAPAPAEATQRAPEKVTKYSLPPALYKKAHDLALIRFRFTLISFVYGLVVLWLVLRLKIAAAYRTWAENKSSKRFLQALVFSPLLIFTIGILGIPADVYEHWVSRSYGLSVQGWGSWLWDWTKGQLISIVIFTILVWILYAVIRKSPRRWWIYFWLVSMPIGLLIFFLEPLIIAPLFFKFEPLQQKDPALTASLERLVHRAGEDIPPQRMFWMHASEKTTALDAYVTGFGASKRIVVFDTTIAKMNTPQIVFVAGHEMGHYVLQHIPQLLAFGAAFLFLFFYLGYRSIGWVLARWGPSWEIRGLDDWASLPALLLLLSVFSFLALPLTSAVSRHYEHQADQYGLEVTHGLTPDSGQVAAQSFQTLGEVDLADPEPNPVDVFLFYSHPSIPDRVNFALTYDPWSKGQSPEFAK